MVNALLKRKKPKAKIFEWREWEYEFWHRHSLYAAELNKLIIGLFSSEWIPTLQTPRYKFSIYSTHDSTRQVMLAILGAHDIRWPPYRSSLVFEIWELMVHCTQRRQSSSDRKLQSVIIYSTLTTAHSTCHSLIPPLALNSSCDHMHREITGGAEIDDQMR